MYILSEYALKFLQSTSQGINIHCALSVTVCTILFCGDRIRVYCVKYIPHHVRYELRVGEACSYISIATSKLFELIVGVNERMVLAISRKGV